jgi:hypothetical protein
MGPGWRHGKWCLQAALYSVAALQIGTAGQGRASSAGHNCFLWRLPLGLLLLLLYSSVPLLLTHLA